MEKRIPFFHFQSVKAVAKAIDPHLKTLASLKKKALALKEEYDEKYEKLKQEFDAKAAKIKEEYDVSQTQIDALEAGILQATGFHVNDLVKKVIEPTGKTDKMGKPIKVTNYVPTDIVTYDDQTKEFVINIPDEEVSEDKAAEAEAQNSFQYNNAVVEDSVSDGQAQDGLTGSTEDNKEDLGEQDLTGQGLPWS